MRVQYLRAADWEVEWIDSAVELADTCWRDNYKPEEVADDTSDAPSPFGYSVRTFHSHA